MLSRIFSEPLLSTSNKHDYKTFSKSRPACLLHCIGNILSHSSGKWRDSLTMAALSFTFVQYLFIIISARRKDDTNTPVSFPFRTSLSYSKRVFYLITNRKKCVSFQLTKFLLSNEL